MPEPGPLVPSPLPALPPVVREAVPEEAQEPHEVPSLPSMTKMARGITSSLLNTVKGVVQGQKIRVDDAEAARRLGICQTCPFFRHVDQRCSKCGCFMSVKTYLKAERCPVNKW